MEFKGNFAESFKVNTEHPLRNTHYLYMPKHIETKKALSKAIYTRLYFPHQHRGKKIMEKKRCNSLDKGKKGKHKEEFVEAKRGCFQSQRALKII
jgi:hypothetical protein